MQRVTTLSDILEHDFGFLPFLALLQNNSLNYREECFMLCQMKLISKRCYQVIRFTWPGIEQISGLVACYILMKNRKLLDLFVGTKSLHLDSTPYRERRLDLEKFPLLETLALNPLIDVGENCFHSSLKSLTLTDIRVPRSSPVLQKNLQTITILKMSGGENDFVVLEKMPSLTSLKMTSSYDLYQFPILTNLTHLEIKVHQNHDILGMLTNLKKLGISSTSRMDTNYLRPLTNLTRLSLTSSSRQENAFNIDPIFSLHNLCHLSLSLATKSEKLNKLSSLTNLYSLALGPHVEPLNDFYLTKGLRKLFIDCGNHLSNSIWYRYPNLTTLSLSAFSCDVRSLASLTNLTKLSLGKNDIYDTGFLHFTFLRALTVCSNKSLSSKTITKLTRLKYLRLTKCPMVTDYAFLFSPNLSTILTDLTLTEGVKALLFQRCVIVGQS